MKLQRHLVLSACLLLLFLLAACSRDEDPGSGDIDRTTESSATTEVAEELTGAAQGGVAEATPTVEITPTPSITPTPTRVPTGPVTVCMAEEPPSLYLYGPDSAAAQIVREVIYDGPIDTRDYGFQPVLLEKIPSLADGDARLETVTVGAGDVVVDSSGNVVTLRDGIVVQPAGCFLDNCAVTFYEDEAAAAGVEAATAIGTVEMDQLQVDFTLLPDLMWSDGEPLTAEDSVFSYELATKAVVPPRMRTGGQGVVPARRVDPVERTASYTALDERQVRWTGLPGVLDSYYQGNFFSPLPEHQLGGMSIEELLQAEESARLPMGWGPYVISEWTAGEQIVAERNPNYFRASEDVPYFDQVIFRFLGENVEGVTDLVASGDCDIVTQDALTNDWASYTQREEAGDLILHTTPSAVWEHLDFGINPAASWRGDFFEDARVRQAIAHCVNREAIMNEVADGRSVTLDSYLSPDHPLLENVELTNYNYDPQRAVALMQEAGWRDTNGDGVAESYGVPGMVDGTTLIFNFVTTSSDVQQRIAQMVSADLAQCGFRVNVNPQPVAPQTFFNGGMNSPIFGRLFDMTSFAWFSDAMPACHLYTSSQIPTTGNGWMGFNVSGYTNEAYDAACAAAQGTVPGMEAFATNHVEAVRIFNQELPAVPLFMHVQAALAGPDIEGLELDATMPIETWNVEEFRRAGE